MFRGKIVKSVSLLAILIMTLSLAACGNNSSSSDEQTKLGSKKIEIPYIASDNSATRSLVIAEVLKKAGYDVITTPVQASGPLYASVATNEDAFHASGIFPSVDKSYYNKFKSNLTLYDKNNFVDNVRVGLAVPKYVNNVDSIEDLDGNKSFGESVDYKIQGTDARNGVMKLTKDEVGKDNLAKYKLNESSDQEQFKKIQKAYKSQQPILVTAMDPSWIVNELDLKMLKDPDKIYGSDDQHINLVFNKGFKDNHPAAFTIATRMSDDWSQKDEEKLAKKIFVDQQDPEKVAKNYVDDHENKVDDWLKDIK
ncbi:ABC transporter substrate-binding protein [Staphylococcus gallinarum]|uniref:glycine betaine ABC transporter substrate-binding protein n=1 Tax=Staphylococcus gallinarum TaxID=1293 RepID=UPI000E682DBB|nr:glycine betaine ABC transporter substrate-binding protein [Staphylococcus gallinarum]MCD8871694.1 ABC transporter substrate-binding protein [Staphylococcus gallinarum]MCW0986067.1 ABC transporter substrate-binding protein [Staphylococcus gallinarum]RIO81773.1 ABC transporter substrate-binding protein [Staphylococcus gallinarum]